MDVNRLRQAGAAFERPRLAPELSELRRRFDPAYDHACAVEAGEVSAYGSGHVATSVRLSNGRTASTEPFCGDCGALRRPTGPCGACGSQQAPNLSRMNPRARGMIE